MVNNRLSWEQGEALPGHAGSYTVLGNVGPGKKHTPNLGNRAGRGQYCHASRLAGLISVYPSRWKRFIFRLGCAVQAVIRGGC